MTCLLYVTVDAQPVVVKETIAKGGVTNRGAKLTLSVRPNAYRKLITAALYRDQDPALEEWQRYKEGGRR